MIYRPLLLLCSLLCLAGCRDEFSLEGPFQDIPVAYGYLNAEDGRHFVRVEKAFLEAGGNAEQIAGIADSIYYAADEATVLLENRTTGRSTELERVNAQDFGRERADGIFAASPNVAYTVRDADLELRGGDEVRLTIQRPGREDAVATTTMLRPLTVRRPVDMIRIEDYGRPLVLSWTKSDNAAIFDVRIRMNIRELFPADPGRNRERTLEWTVASGFVPGADQQATDLVRFDTRNEAFYQFLGGALEPIDGVVRRFVDFDVQIAAAGQEVLDRRNLENANAGITSSQSLPRYTNLEGGIGLFTSNTVVVQEGVLIGDESRDSLENGIYTRELGFR